MCINYIHIYIYRLFSIFNYNLLCLLHYLFYNFIRLLELITCSINFNIYLLSPLYFFFNVKKKSLKFFKSFKYLSSSISTSRTFCSKTGNNSKINSSLVSRKQCTAIIKSKKSKFYGCRCPYKAKFGNFCKKHNFFKNATFSTNLNTCYGLTKIGVRCSRLVNSNKTLCYQHSFFNENGAYLNKVTNICCITGLKSLSTASATVIICDPPYNIGKNFGNNFDNMEMSKYIS